MVITMSDTSIHKLIKRCREKEKEGYDYVTQIKQLSHYGRDYKKAHQGKQDYTGSNCSIKFKVAMKKG